MKSKTILALLCLLAFNFVGCDPNNPSVSSGDPEGTIPLSMRNANNGNTYLEDFLHIDNGDNFTCSHIASVGSVSGLGKITEIPATGWSDHVAVQPGQGYVACSSSWTTSDHLEYLFYRIYVVDYVKSVDGGVIGADVKYQGPFYGKDVKIAFKDESITVPAGESLFVPFKTEDYIAGVEIECSEAWCHARLSSKNSSFLYNGITISTDPVEETTSASATIKVTTGYGKSADITVVRLGAEPYVLITKAWNTNYPVSFQPLSFDNQGVISYANEVNLSLQSNCDLSGIQLSGQPDWLHATVTNDIIQLTCDVNKTTSSREAKLTITTADGKASCELHVTQEAGYFHLYEAPEKVYFDRIGGNVMYRINSSFVPNITCTETWISCRMDDIYRDLYITCVGGCETERKAVIHFEGLEQTIEVTQSKYTVGDTYSEGAVTGTVFYMNAGERYIYQNLGDAQWSTEQIITGANSTDPMQNLQAIRNLGHMERYPAFQLLETMQAADAGWFLPAYERDANYLRSLPTLGWCSNEYEYDQNLAYKTSGGVWNKVEAHPIIVLHAF